MDKLWNQIQKTKLGQAFGDSDLRDLPFRIVQGLNSPQLLLTSVWETQHPVATWQFNTAGYGGYESKKFLRCFACYDSWEFDKRTSNCWGSTLVLFWETGGGQVLHTSFSPNLARTESNLGIGDIHRDQAWLFHAQCWLSIFDSSSNALWRLRSTRFSALGDVKSRVLRSHEVATRKEDLKKTLL